MIVRISSDAELDISEGFAFYEKQEVGLGGYFRDCIVADIESLSFLGGVHAKSHGYYRMLAKRFPYIIYYEVAEDQLTVVAVLDARRNPSWIRRRLS